MVILVYTVESLPKKHSDRAGEHCSPLHKRWVELHPCWERRSRRSTTAPSVAYRRHLPQRGRQDLASSLRHSPGSHVGHSLANARVTSDSGLQSKRKGVVAAEGRRREPYAQEAKE